jgi:hypothetical protein
MEIIKLPLIKLSHKSKNYHLISSSSDDSKIGFSGTFIKKKFIFDKNLIQKNLFEDNQNIKNFNNNQKVKLSLKIKKPSNQNSLKKLVFDSKMSCDNFFKNKLLQSFEQFTSLNSEKVHLINVNKDIEKNEKKIPNNLSQFNIGKDDYEEKKKKQFNKERKIKLKNTVVFKDIGKKTIFNNELIKSVLN